MRHAALLVMGLCAGLVCAAPLVGIAQADQLPALPEEGRTARASLPASGPTIARRAPPGSDAGQAAPPVTAELALSLADAVSRGLAHNLGAVLAEQDARAAAGARTAAVAGLLPSLSGRISEVQQRVNLEAFGFPLPQGANPIVGPYTVFDARLSLVQPLFDLTALETARAVDRQAAAATAAARDAREAVVVACATLYLQVAAAASRLDAARAQLRTAEALAARAAALRAAGVVAGIDVLRAEVQLRAQAQRVIACENDLAKQKLWLARAIGLPLDRPFVLADEIPYAALPAMNVDAALKEAMASRSDLESAEASLQAAEAARRAVAGDLLPSVRFTADYGAIGRAVDTAKMTYAVGVGARIPLFQGGRVRGQLAQADARVAQQRARLDDLRVQIELEVRAALLDVAAADERVRVAASAVELADAQLAQAQDRFAAGVANNLEVVQAQEAVATATENHLAARFAYNLAKLALARALGVAERRAVQNLEGAR